jgi:hypothetical protein
VDGLIPEGCLLERDDSPQRVGLQRLRVAGDGSLTLVLEPRHAAFQRCDQFAQVVEHR